MESLMRSMARHERIRDFICFSLSQWAVSTACAEIVPGINKSAAYFIRPKRVLHGYNGPHEEIIVIGQ